MPQKPYRTAAKLIASAFVLLHVLIYLEVVFDAPLVHSSTETPAEMQALELCDAKFPSYLNPLQKPTYTYCLEGSTQEISEQAESLFGYSPMQPLTEDPYDYWQGEEVEGKLFMRQLAGEVYTNPLFFLVQYLLAGAFILVTVRQRRVSS